MEERHFEKDPHYRQTLFTHKKEDLLQFKQEFLRFSVWQRHLPFLLTDYLQENEQENLTSKKMVISRSDPAEIMPRLNIFTKDTDAMRSGENYLRNDLLRLAYLFARFARSRKFSLELTFYREEPLRFIRNHHRSMMFCHYHCRGVRLMEDCPSQNNSDPFFLDLAEGHVLILKGHQQEERNFLYSLPRLERGHIEAIFIDEELNH